MAWCEEQHELSWLAGGQGDMGLGRGDPLVMFPCSCLVHPEPGVTVGAGPRQHLSPLRGGHGWGRCHRCDLAAVKETPVCVSPTLESSLSYPSTWVISPWRGVVSGERRAAREGLGRGTSPRQR